MSEGVQKSLFVSHFKMVIDPLTNVGMELPEQLNMRKLWMKRWWGECLTVRVGPRWDHTLRERDMGHLDTPQTPISLSGSALIYSPISINLNLFRLKNHVKILDEGDKACTFQSLYFRAGCSVLTDRIGLKNLPDTFLQPSRLRIAWREQIINRLEASSLAIALWMSRSQLKTKMTLKPPPLDPLNQILTHWFSKFNWIR